MVQRSEPQQPAPAAPEAGAALASSRRRRFIQAGVVPVSLTLASRPVMAWHCNSTSAWGSAVLRNGVASVTARAEAKRINGNECWTISNWYNNTARDAVIKSKKPWDLVGEKLFTTPCSGTVAQTSLKVSRLFSSLSGTTTGTKVYDLIRANPDSFVAYMLIARLNVLLAPTNFNVGQCMMSSTGEDMMIRMASQGPGVFKPLNSTGAPWTWPDIKQYLKDNYLVWPS